MAKKLEIKQIRSAIDRHFKQKRTIRALGIRKLNQTVIQNDTPQIRGMIAKVSHLVEVREIDDEPRAKRVRSEGAKAKEAEEKPKVEETVPEDVQTEEEPKVDEIPPEDVEAEAEKAGPEADEVEEETEEKVRETDETS